MSNFLTVEQKRDVVARYRGGENPNAIARRYGLRDRQVIFKWLKQFSLEEAPPKRNGVELKEHPKKAEAIKLWMEGKSPQVIAMRLQVRKAQVEEWGLEHLAANPPQATPDPEPALIEAEAAPPPDPEPTPAEEPAAEETAPARANQPLSTSPPLFSAELKRKAVERFKAGERVEVIAVDLGLRWPNQIRTWAKGLRAGDSQPSYSAEVRREAVERYRQGASPGELAAEYGCNWTTIYAWVRAANQERPRRDSRARDEARIQELQAQYVQLPTRKNRLFPREHRRIIAELFAAGEDYLAIARFAGCSVGTVYSAVAEWVAPETATVSAPDYRAHDHSGETRRRQNRSEAQKREICQLWAEGEEIEEVARAYGVSQASLIYRWARELKIDRDPKFRGRHKLHPKRAEALELAKQHPELAHWKIAEQLGVSQSVVSGWLRDPHPYQEREAQAQAAQAKAEPAPAPAPAPAPEPELVRFTTDTDTGADFNGSEPDYTYATPVHAPGLLPNGTREWPLPLKLQIVQRWMAGESATDLSREFDLAPKMIYGWGKAFGLSVDDRVRPEPAPGEAFGLPTRPLHERHKRAAKALVTKAYCPHCQAELPPPPKAERGQWQITQVACPECQGLVQL